MKTIVAFIIAFISISAYAENTCELPEGATTGKPVVKVNPNIKSKVNEGDCALVTFKLVEKKGSEGKGLVPKSIKVVSSSNKTLAKAVKKSVSKWLYLSKSHSAGDVLYYSYEYKNESKP
ncbi:hypothetical protein [Teredinibacter franksiae]|uniref:hypothetical protein n=1 Tax=Teredinibacter franksiae TaxID=2761453 RepID=UPI001625384D|nr:hypothetical protein [Teredinibacter franksiae]